VLCGLIPGGISKEITAAHAARVLESVKPSGAVDAARCGPVIAAIAIGCATDVSRFGGRDRFAAYNGTAPIEVSSGNRKIHRLSGLSSGGSATPSSPASRPTPGELALRTREGSR
jgi:transposase